MLYKYFIKKIKFFKNPQKSTHAVFQNIRRLQSTGVIIIKKIKQYGVDFKQKNAIILANNNMQTGK